MSVIGATQTLQLANLHGDVVATQANTTITTATYNEPDKYGNTTTTGAPTSRYGYLGTYQRSTETLAGTTLMGARIYNPSAGQFLTVDPVLDGGANLYGYPADPVNLIDTTGEPYTYVRYWSPHECFCKSNWSGSWHSRSWPVGMIPWASSRVA
jgi:RHS repeat-associated protein